MPTFISQIIATLVRAAVIWASGWLAAHGGPTFTDDQIGKFVAETVPLIAMVAWSVWEKYRSRQKQLTAQASPGPVSEHHVDQAVAAGAAPSVLTKPNEVPSLTVTVKP